MDDGKFLFPFELSFADDGKFLSQIEIWIKPFFLVQLAHAVDDSLQQATPRHFFQGTNGLLV